MKQRGYFLRWAAVLSSMVLFMVPGLSGCRNEAENRLGCHIYYLNKELTKTVGIRYEPKKKQEEELVQELLKELRTKPEKVELTMPFPKEVYVKKWKVENHRLYLYFTGDYLSLETAQEVLARAAYVRTLVQLPGIESVTFYIGDAPLLDKNKKPIGFMTAETFVENTGKQINEIQIATITLYFVNQDGTKLVRETQKVPYNTNISMEKLVMERLLSGPLAENSLAAIPEETTLVSVSVLDGVCFVSLDENFLDHNHIPGELVIYSIVNSLAELSNVNKVQISVNGDTNITYQKEFSLDTMYERDLEYVEEE